MVMNEIRKGKTGMALKVILMGLMALAVGGMVFTDVGGFFRGGGIASNDVAKVGQDGIPIQRFDRDLRNTLSRVGMSPQEAYARGYTTQFLTEEIRNSVVQQSARELGIRIPDERATETIRDIIKPGLVEGRKPEEVLQQILRNQGMSEGQFVESIQTQMSVQPFIQALQSGAAVSQAMVKDLVIFQQETRDISYVVFRDEDFKAVKIPKDEELIALYDVSKEQFAEPETRSYQIIEVTPTSAPNATEDEIVEETYALADQIDDLAASGAAAQDVASQLNLKIVNHDPISLTSKDIDPKIIQTVFEIQEGEISPVFETGEHKFVAVSLTKITPKSYKSFETAKPDLQKRWTNDQRNMDNKLAVLALAGDINNKKTTLQAVAAKEGKSVQSMKGISRMEEIKPPFNSQDLPSIFRAKKDEAVISMIDGGYAISVVTNIIAGGKEDAKLAQQTEERLLNDMRTENMNMYLENKRLQMDIRVNEALLHQVYGQQDDQQQ